MQYKDGYYLLEPGESQYDGLDLRKPVEARYIPADSEKERGNPLCEALPPSLEGEDAMLAYSKGIPGYRYSDIKNMNRKEKRALVRQFRDIRVPFFNQQDVEDAFHDALCSSYAMRELVPVDDEVNKITVGGKEEKPGYLLWADRGAPTFGYFSLVGPSGVGKTSTLHMLYSHYPQVILHLRKCGRLTQIVYLFVECPANSNLKMLYEEVGIAIDCALRNTAHDYQNYIAKGGGGLAGMARRVADLIERFSVGIIIFDEIQNINFSRTKDNGFFSLLSVMNTTKCAFCCVGLPAAREKLGSELAVKRRTGDTINGGDYCDDRKVFKTMVNTLLRYQVFSPPVEVTDEILDAFYKHTLGVVDQLVTLYSRVSLDYIDDDDPKVDASYITAVAKKYYPGIEQLIREERYDDLYALNESVKAGMEKIFAEDDDRKEQKEHMLSNAGNRAEEAFIRDNIVSFLTSSADYEASVVTAAFNKVMRRAHGKSEKEVTRLVIEELGGKDNSKAKKPKPKHIDTSEIQDMSSPAKNDKEDAI